MSWWTEARDQATKGLGIATPQETVKTAADVVKEQVKAASGENDVKKSPAKLETNPFSDAFKQVGSMPRQQKIGVIILAGVALFFVFRKMK